MAQQLFSVGGKTVIRSDPKENRRQGKKLSTPLTSRRRKGKKREKTRRALLFAPFFSFLHGPPAMLSYVLRSAGRRVRERSCRPPPKRGGRKTELFCFMILLPPPLFSSLLLFGDAVSALSLAKTRALPLGPRRGVLVRRPRGKNEERKSPSSAHC